MERLRASWLRWNPDVEYRFYDDADCREFVQCHYPQHAAIYDGLPHAIQRADFFRYLVVHQCGGVYADLDMECLRPFDRFFSMSGAVFNVETHFTAIRQRELGYRLPFQIGNCIFAAEPGHEFLARIIQKIASTPVSTGNDDAAIEDATGPRLLTRLYFSLSATQREDLYVLPQIHWLPPTSYPNCWPLNRNMFARHHFHGTWKTRTCSPRTLRRQWIERSKLPNPWPRHINQRATNLG